MAYILAKIFSVKTLSLATCQAVFFAGLKSVEGEARAPSGLSARFTVTVEREG